MIISQEIPSPTNNGLIDVDVVCELVLPNHDESHTALIRIKNIFQIRPLNEELPDPQQLDK
jgi:hypothetical protein